MYNYSATVIKVYKNRQWLFEKYVDERRTIRDIAKECKVGIRTIARWLYKHQIITRKGKDAFVKDRSGKNNPNWKGRTICPVCGNRKSSNAKECFKCCKRGGEQNPNWKGIANIKVLIREYFKGGWRLEVFKRDRYICQRCKKIKHGELEAHHIKRLAPIIDEQIKIFLKRGFSLENADGRLQIYLAIVALPILRNIDNGITLCKKCHKKIHKGKRQDYYELPVDLYNYWGTVIDVYDADTVTVMLEVGFDIILQMKLRLWGINSPEIKTKDKEEKQRGIKARNFVRRKILNKRVKIRTYKREKFGRYLADIFLDDGTLLNELIIRNDYAVEYFGGRR